MHHLTPGFPSTQRCRRAESATTRRLLKCFITAATLAIAPAAVSLAQTKPILKAKLGIGGSSSQVALLAMNVARSKGFIRDEGLELEITDFGSGQKGLAALVGRDVDLALGVHEYTIQMQAKNVELKSIVVSTVAPGIVVGITKDFVPKFKSIADLKGAKVGLSAPGSSSHLFLNQLLVRNGLTPTDVSVVGVGNAAGAVAAIRTGGELQALVNFDPVISELERSGDLKPIIDLRSIEATRTFYKRDYVFTTIYSSAEFINKNPEVCQAFVNGFVRALKWMQTASPEEILAQVPETYWRNNRELYLKSIVKNLGGFSKDGRISPEGVQTVYDGLLTYDKAIQSSKIDLAKTYDNRFVSNAKVSFEKK